MNVWTVTGRIGKDAEVKQVGDGTVTEFSLAVDSGFGERRVTTWVRVSGWGKRFEAVAAYLLKGKQIAVSGELTNREYEKSDGSKAYSLELRASDLTLIGGKDEPKPATPQAAPKPAPKQVEEFVEDDIPF